MVATAVVANAVVAFQVTLSNASVVPVHHPQDVISSAITTPKRMAKKPLDATLTSALSARIVFRVMTASVHASRNRGVLAGVLKAHAMVHVNLARKTVVAMKAAPTARLASRWGMFAPAILLPSHAAILPALRD